MLPRYFSILRWCVSRNRFYLMPESANTIFQRAAFAQRTRKPRSRCFSHVVAYIFYRLALTQTNRHFAGGQHYPTSRPASTGPLKNSPLRLSHIIDAVFSGILAEQEGFEPPHVHHALQFSRLLPYRLGTTPYRRGFVISGKSSRPPPAQLHNLIFHIKIKLTTSLHF